MFRPSARNFSFKEVEFDNDDKASTMKRIIDKTDCTFSEASAAFNSANHELGQITVEFGETSVTYKEIMYFRENGMYRTVPERFKKHESDFARWYNINRNEITTRTKTISQMIAHMENIIL